MTKVLIVCQNDTLRKELIEMASQFPLLIESIAQVEDLNQGHPDDIDHIILNVDEQSAPRIQSVCASVSYFSCPVHIVSSMGRTENLYILNQLESVPSLLVKDATDFQAQFLSVLSGLCLQETTLAENWEIENTITSSQQISPVVDRIEQMMEQKTSFSSLSRLARTVASELIRSSIYLGLKEQGLFVPANFGGTRTIELMEAQQVTFRAKVSNNHLVLNVSDNFGSINSRKILSHLYQYAIRSNQTYDTDFVGLGYFIIYNICSEIRMEIRPGISTSVTARVLIAHRNKEIDQQKTSIRISSRAAGS